eukprot:GHVR01110397.1.p1 GENE.GHVR01110397.1~~GHVR01110397.1.p1  ORF type:complete len:211 (+),score=27.53 GHVR01110397.1:66-698(+)
MAGTSLERQQLQKKCEESLNETIRIAAEASEISVVTADALNYQTEKLTKIESETNELKQKLDTSQYLISGMKSWWGGLKQMIIKPPSKETAAVPVEKRIYNERGTHVRPNSLKTDIQNDPISGSPSHCGRLSSSMSHTRTRCQKPEFDRKIDEGLDMLDDMLGDLHSRALQMNSTIEYQSHVLGRVSEKVECSNARIAEQRKDMRKIMGK